MKHCSLSDYAATVFDLDGTLLDTLRDISEAANRSLEKHGFAAHPQEAFCRFVGDGPAILFERATNASSSTAGHVIDLVETYQKECAIQNDQHTALYPGMAELLDEMTAHHLPLTILTNKRQPHAELCVKRFMRAWDWKVVLGSGDHIPIKPDPTGALKVANTLQVDPADCVYLGDTDVDMWTAKRAGMTAVGVLWGFRERTELENAGADFIIEDPTELI